LSDGYFIQAGAGGGFEFFPFEAASIKEVKPFNSSNNLFKKGGRK
jgi:hypothetical protein